MGIKSITVNYDDGRQITLDTDLKTTSIKRPIKQIKDGAKVNGLRVEILLAFDIAHTIFSSYGVDTVMTEGTGGTHGKASLHYVGLAIDLRTRDLTPTQQLEARDKLAIALGAQYDVILESDHIHIEFQPK